MTPIPTEKLSQYINKPIVMEYESKKVDIRIKEIKGTLIRGVNITKSCLFEVINLDDIKFYMV